MKVELSSIRTALLSLSERSVVQWALPEARRAVTFPVGRPATNSFALPASILQDQIADSEERWRAMQHYVTGNTCRALLLNPDLKKSPARPAASAMSAPRTPCRPQPHPRADWTRGSGPRAPKAGAGCPQTARARTARGAAGRGSHRMGPGPLLSHVDRHGLNAHGPDYLRAMATETSKQALAEVHLHAGKAKSVQRGHPGSSRAPLRASSSRRSPPPREIGWRRGPRGHVHRMGPLGNGIHRRPHRVAAKRTPPSRRACGLPN